MLFCKNCGNQMIDTAKFCPNCGSKIIKNESIDDLISELWKSIFPKSQDIEILENYGIGTDLFDEDQTVPTEIERIIESLKFSFEDIVLLKTTPNERYEIIDFPTGDIYIGEFSNDLRNGLGSYFEKKDNEYILEYFGGWLNDLKSDQGILFNTLYGTIIYKGEWLHNLYNGHGTLFNSPKYVGSFENGLCVGFGSEFYANGKKSFEGNFILNQKHGEGIDYRMDGSMLYKGYFSYGFKNGVFIEFGANGDIISEEEWFMGLKRGKGNYYYTEFDKDDEDIDDSPIKPKDGAGLR